eukprot:1175562-Prorocentrum_minimum.AAC.1
MKSIKYSDAAVSSARPSRQCRAGQRILEGTPPVVHSVPGSCALSLADDIREGDPGRGGLQGTRPRAGQLGRPAPRGLSVCAG